MWGWRGAFLFVAGLSIATALLLIVMGSILPRVVHKPGQQPAKESGQKVGLDLLLSAPILRNLLFFFCLAMANGGIQTFTVVGMAADPRDILLGRQRGAVGLSPVQRRGRTAGRHHRRPHAAP